MQMAYCNWPLASTRFFGIDEKTAAYNVGVERRKSFSASLQQNDVTDSVPLKTG